jgi:hypothetical protein
MEEPIPTRYGPVRQDALARLQWSFDTSRLLGAADQADQFCSPWREDLRSDLLALQGMAHTVIHGAPLTTPPGQETLTEMAASLSLAFSDAAEALRDLARMLDQIADLAPE